MTHVYPQKGQEGQSIKNREACAPEVATPSRVPVAPPRGAFFPVGRGWCHPLRVPMGSLRNLTFLRMLARRVTVSVEQLGLPLEKGAGPSQRKTLHRVGMTSRAPPLGLTPKGPPSTPKGEKLGRGGTSCRPPYPKVSAGCPSFEHACPKDAPVRVYARRKAIAQLTL